MTDRRSGLLAHLSSLPAARPDEPLLERAERFLDWSQRAGFRLWQVLPLNPVGPGNSPYSATSAFAGQHWAPLESGEELDGWAPPWLDDWSLYISLKRHHRGTPWTRWDAELRDRTPAALASARRQLAEEIESERRLQAQIQATALRIRRAAAERGIRWLGDLPFYVAHDSADVWAQRGLFKLTPDGHPTAVAGVPPDDYSDDGQRWNHPVYDWNAMRADRYRWWLSRFDRALESVDALRIDHFRGYSAYWEIDAEAPTAATGRWVEGPGEQLFDALFSAERMNDGRCAPLIAEDLGVIDDAVKSLRDRYQLPGLHVLQFGWSDPTSEHHPDQHRQNALCCTGTHDNDTMRGWLATLPKEVRDALAAHGADDSEVANAAARVTLNSPSAWSVLPLQEILGLGGEARMNLPGTAEGQWRWRAADGELTPELADYWRQLNEAAGRLP